MANFYAQYPASAAGSNASVGINGATAPTSSTEVGGINPGGNLQPLQTDSSGNLLVSLNADVPNLPVNLVQVDGVAVPTGPGASNGGVQRVALSSDSSLLNITGTVSLPTGASTSANQTNGSQTTQVVNGANTLAIGASGNILVSGAAAVGSAPILNPVPVSGVDGGGLKRNLLTDTSGRLEIDTIQTLPLPTGAATAANQTNGTQQTQIVQGGNTAIVTATGAQKVDGSAVTQPISASTLPLPTGAATSALQSNVQSAVGSSATTAITVQGSATGVAIPVSVSSFPSEQNVNLNQVGGSAIAIGQQLAAASLPVILPAATITTLTPPTTVTVTQATGTNLHTVVDSSALPTGAATAANQTSVIGTVGAGTAATNSELTGGVFNTALPSLTNGQQAAIQLDSSGRQIVAQATAAALNATVVGSGNFTVVQPTGTNLHTVLDSGTLTTLTTVTNVGSINTNADQTSAAITTTTTSAAKTLSTGNSLSLTVAVTAVSGTTPTYDLQIQSSVDGTNWVTAYQIPRITANGFWNTPLLQLPGIQYRYVETLGGTTPSFTRTITTNRSNIQGQWYRNLIDRTIVPTTTNSVTGSLFVEGLTNYTAVVNQGAGGSAVTFALDGSPDNVNWVQNLTTVAGVIGGATPVTMNYSGPAYSYIRARVVTGVASTTISYLELNATQTTGLLSSATTITSNQGTANTIANAWPVKLTDGTSSTSFAAASTAATAAQPAQVVALSPNSNTPKTSGYISSNAPVNNVYSTTNITTATYVQLVASTTSTTQALQIFDSSGQAMILATGGSGSEVIQAYIPPGGTNIPLTIPAGTRVAYKALTANATTGYLLIDFLG